jgi:uncharacterized integral membrane protein
MDQHEFRPEQSPASPAPRSQRWIAPAAYLAAILIPALTLIFSNLESSKIRFAWIEGSAPLWLILAITFASGALVTRLLGWTWRRMRHRRNADGGSK